MASIPRQFASERDFVAQYILPTLKKASQSLNISDVTDFAIEKKINSGISDLVIERVGIPVLITEAKFKKKVGKIEIDIEPRDPDVVKQAVSYAVIGGYPYYATCNIKRIVLFQLQPGVKVFESEIASFEYLQTPDWAERILKIILGIEKVAPKPLDDTLVDILHEAYNDLYPEFLDSLRKQLENLDFSKRFVDWIERQGLKLIDENIRLIASQATYMELNKFLFYHVVRLMYPEHLRPLKIEEYQDVAGTLKRYYDDVLKIDYAPIYEKTIISEIPFTKRAEERILTLLDTLNLFDFSQMESDFIGRIYEKLIPPDERKRLGQFYTPPGIVDFITRLVVRNPDDIILDPGCGSGSFLVRAYHQLRELKGFPADTRNLSAIIYNKQILEQIYGIDINQFPAHLSVINLAIQNPFARIDKVNVIVEDFFNIKPGVSTLTGFQSFTTKGSTSTVTLPPFFNTVIGNPPYIRQELLSSNEKKIIKNLIENEYKNKIFIGSGSGIKKDSIVLNKQSDIFIYFFIHGLKLIKDKGKLGFISSNKWLEVSYGEPFQQFLLDYAKIICVVEFDRAIFPDAEVNTAITILEKENDLNKRNSHFAKFVRFKKKLTIDKAIEIVEKSKKSVNNKDILFNIIKQKDLEVGKWNLYLRAPPIFKKIEDSVKTKPLINFGEVFRGPTTGYNPYFILDQEKVNNLNIEKKFLKTCLISPKIIKNLIVKDVNDYFFVVSKNKSEIDDTNALKYIEFGESLEVEVKRGSSRGLKKLPQISTIKNRKPYWYSLPDFPASDILIPKLADKRLIALRNDLKVQATDVFYYIILNEKQNITCITAFLNSSIGALFGELYGRSYGGGVLDIKVYETKKLPILDPSLISSSEKKQLEEAFELLVNTINERVKVEDELKKLKSFKPNTIGLFELEKKNNLNKPIKKEEEAYRNLDNVVYDILEFSEEERQQVEDGLKELQEIRTLRTKI